MARQALTDGSGHWFDPDAATSYEEATRWNGNNHISKATGTQFDHEKLYFTKGRKWVLNCWSQWQGSSETWEEIDPEVAARWLSTNGYEHPSTTALEI